MKYASFKPKIKEMEKLRFLSKYFTPVATTIDVNRPLKTIEFETKLIDCTIYTKPIKTTGIEVGECTKVGKHIVTYNQLLND